MVFPSEVGNPNSVGKSVQILREKRVFVCFFFLFRKKSNQSGAFIFIKKLEREIDFPHKCRKAGHISYEINPNKTIPLDFT